MRTRISLSVCCILLALHSLFASEERSAASGQPSRRGPEIKTILARFDRDQNGSIDRKEYEATRFGQQRPELFASLDRDEEGRITLDELRGLAGRARAGRPRALPSVKLGEPEPQIDETQARVPGEPPLRKPRPAN